VSALLVAVVGFVWLALAGMALAFNRACSLLDRRADRRPPRDDLEGWLR